MSDLEAERAEALDPATPPARLAALMEKHLDAVLQNPALPLVLTAEPHFWARVAWPVRTRLAASPSCPSEFVAWVRVADERHLEEQLVLNRWLPVSLRREIFLASDSEQLREREDLSFDVLSAAEGSLVKRARRSKPLSSGDFEALLRLGVPGRQLAIDHKRCPPELLEQVLARDGNRFLHLANSPRLSADRLAWFLTHPDEDVRRAAATNPLLTPAQFDALAQDPDLRLSMAANPSLPEAWRERFLRDPDPAVRTQLARNRALPLEAQLALAGALEWDVRLALADNSGATREARALARRRP